MTGNEARPVKPLEQEKTFNKMSNKSNFLIEEAIANCSGTMETNSFSKNGGKMSRGNILKISLFMICMLQTATMLADRFTVNGITYDMPGLVNGYVFQHAEYDGVQCIQASVAGVSNDFVGNLVIPVFPAQIACNVTFKEYTIWVTGINSYAFNDNTKITSVTLPATITEIGHIPFYGCTSLNSFEVVADNPVYSSLEGVLYNKNKSILLQYPPNKTGNSFSIPGTVTEIAENAFQECLHLATILIPENVTAVGDKVFFLSKIESVTFSRSVASIGDGIFYDCFDLTDITVFWDSPSEVNTSVDYGDLDFDFGLGEIKERNITLHVPSGTKAAYLASTVWKDFNIVEDANETGITDVPLSNFKIYFTPTNGILFVECENFSTIKLYDMLGKEVLTQNANGETEINISHLNKGVYCVSIISDGRIIGSSKITKQ